MPVIPSFSNRIGYTVAEARFLLDENLSSKVAAATLGRSNTSKGNNSIVLGSGSGSLTGGISIIGGQPANAPGGAVTVMAGSGTGTGSGGAITITGGSGGTSGGGGNLILVSGKGYGGKKDGRICIEDTDGSELISIGTDKTLKVLGEEIPLSMIKEWISKIKFEATNCSCTSAQIFQTGCVCGGS
jgi:hypothetical protein